MRTSRWKIIAVALLAAVMAGCTEYPSTSAVESPRVSEPASARSVIVGTFDDEMSRIAREEIPGFAGYFVDSGGATVVQLVDESRLDQARSVVSRARARMGLSQASEVRTRKAQYDFAALKDWHDAVTRLLPSETVLWTDIDEVRNQVVLAIENETSRIAVRRAADKVGMPTSAFLIIRESRPTQANGTLDDRHRPVAGGVRIWSQGHACTLGFNAVLNGIDYFLTNSHCSDDQYNLDGTEMSQPDSGNVIGTEFKDPGTWYRPFPNSNYCYDIYNTACRFSDASIFSYAPGVTRERGRIAQTLYFEEGQAGSLQINTQEPYLNIVQNWDAYDAAPVGTEMHKIGQRTGWTAGHVVQTCVHYGMLKCQWVADIYLDQGDSGSPIFAIIGSVPSIALHGILWGSDENGNTWYSTMHGIEMDMNISDLGVLYTPPPPPPPPPSLNVTIYGAFSIQPNVSCDYSADVSGGDGGPYSITWYIGKTAVGTGDAISVSQSDSFTLTVRANDGSALGSDFANVTVSEEANECLDQ